MDVETLARELHEAGREAVAAGQTLAQAVTTGAVWPFVEWADLPEQAREGRRVMARWLLARYTIMLRVTSG
jgi:hypothetical protein